MRPARRSLAALLLTLTGFAGAGAAIAAEPLLRPVDATQWQAELDELSGSIVVVDYWASWCVPCLDRFPAMVEMAGRFAERGVVFLALDLDDPGDGPALERAETFAREQGGPVRHYRSTLPILEAFDGLGLLGIPAVDVFGRDGQRVTRLTGDDPNRQFTDEDVEKAVESLLAAGDGAAPGS